MSPMSRTYEGRSIRRSSKDLGRAVALWLLARRADVDSDLHWRAAWDAAAVGGARLIEPARRGWKVLADRDLLAEAYFVNRLALLANFSATEDEYVDAYASLGRLLGA